MKILIASGGSGGHIFPAVSLARELGKENAEIVFVASKRALDKSILQKESYAKIFLSINPMPYGFRPLAIIIFLIKLAADSFRALGILIRHKPNAVVGFGGYTAGSIVLLAALMGIKTIIHEQNLIPGRTNRLLDGVVNRIAVSFSETQKYLKSKNAVFTGNPLREESLRECRREAQEGMGLDASKITILVMGGSQGARSLNSLVSGSLCLLPASKKERIQVIHIAGDKDAGSLQGYYNKCGVKSKVFGFVQKINEAYSACDIAISRSGAAAIFELAAFEKPMILVPYPSEKNNQRFNAAFFARKGAAISGSEKEFDKEKMKHVISELIDSPEKRKELSENAKKLRVIDGARRLKEVVLNEITQ